MSSTCTNGIESQQDSSNTFLYFTSQADSAGRAFPNLLKNGTSMWVSKHLYTGVRVEHSRQFELRWKASRVDKFSKHVCNSMQHVLPGFCFFSECLTSSLCNITHDLKENKSGALAKGKHKTRRLEQIITET